MRIAVGGWLHETNTFSTMATEYDDFYFTRGDDVLAAETWQIFAREGHDLFPLVRASTHPSGRLTRDCFDRIGGELLDGIRAALPLDAIFLGLHGAMEVEGLGDGEGAILREIRAITGPEVFICGTLDLHGNLSPEFVGATDFLTALRTAPHRDGEETLKRGVELMMHCLESGIRPVTELVKLPLLVPGEAGVTEVEPAKSLFGRLPEMDRVPEILVSSIMIGCAWTDSPHTTVSVLISGMDRQAVRREAYDLAEAIWARRSEFKLDMPAAPTDETIQAALEAPEAPVFISDSGDNTTAGGAGDSPFFLQRLIASGAENAVVAGITDPEAVRKCFDAGEGAEVELVIGGRLDTTFSEPFATRARVMRLVEDAGADGPRVLVEIRGVEVVLQSDRGPFTQLGNFERMGIEVGQKKIVVVKLGYLFPELRDYAPKGLMALSPGFGDQRMDRLPFAVLKRPIYPLDQDTKWERPEDSR